MNVYPPIPAREAIAEVRVRAPTLPGPVAAFQGGLVFATSAASPFGPTELSKRAAPAWQRAGTRQMCDGILDAVSRKP